MVKNAGLLSIGLMVIITLNMTEQAEASTYYVAKTGNDANPCTLGRPCSTIARGVAVALSPGDIVQVSSGTYNERLTLSSGGSASGKIIIRGHDGTGCPASVISDVNSRGLRPSPSVTMNGFVLAADYLTLDCFRVTGTSTADAFVVNRGKTNIDIINNFVDASAAPGHPGAGVYLGQSGYAPSTQPSNIYVARNYILNTTYGLLIFCSNCLLEDNEIDTMKSGGSASDDNDYSRVFGEYITFRHNYMHGNSVAYCTGDCHIDCFQTWNIGQTGEVARHITYDRNVCFNAHQGIIARDTTSGIVGSYASHFDWTVTNNVFKGGPIGSSNAWCALFEHVGSVVFANNLCADTGIVGYLNGAAGIHKNNIHYQCGYDPYTKSVNSWSDGVMVSENNFLYSSTRTYTGHSGDILNSDPRFVDPGDNNFRLSALSPAVDAAAVVSLTVDLDGVPRPQGLRLDIGPYEFRPEASPKPQPPTSLQATSN